jgi:hypothetical protein
MRHTTVDVDTPKRSSGASNDTESRDAYENMLNNSTLLSMTARRRDTLDMH